MGGGRTKARTWNPLIKSQITSSWHQCLDVNPAKRGHLKSNAHGRIVKRPRLLKLHRTTALQQMWWASQGPRLGPRRTVYGPVLDELFSAFQCSEPVYRRPD